MRLGRMATSAASLALAALLAAVLAPNPAAGQSRESLQDQQGPTKADCVFSHPAFSGKCTETVEVAAGSTAKDACSVVLECLNDIRCTKTFCSATTLRGGWKLDSAGSRSEPSK